MGGATQRNATAAADLGIYQAMRGQVDYTSRCCHTALDFGQRSLIANQHVVFFQTENITDLAGFLFREPQSFQRIRISFQKTRGTYSHSPCEMLGADSSSLRTSHLYFIFTVSIKIAADRTLTLTKHFQ
mmetsp:Transcript_13258/g.49185  ORF Transcript_13258/g.49185 Transcript_13258/m.49185 type:complete len:129 (-) Transcript_13258:317-703(-)|eukprot:scaffold403_cov241-Pinguiococcus_pyrenoidosus.AAC.3